MVRISKSLYGTLSVCAISALLFTGCTQTKQTADGIRVMPQDKKFSGYLSDYSKLVQNPKLENTLSYARQDAMKNVHRYVAIIVEPVQIYVATKADPKSIPDARRKAMAEYFQVAIERAVSSAFPIVKEPGPLVLRLRSALVGVDAAAAGQEGVNIGSVKVEMELVDSESGEQVAAAVDEQTLGEGAVVGSDQFSREEKFRTAVMAFDGWAARLRAFLDDAHELTPEEISRAEKALQPY